MMKNSETARISKWLFAGCLLVFTLLFTSCARKAYFTSSAIAPQAEGKVKVKRDGNDNFRINVNIKNLPPANQLNPARATYMAWMESSNGTKNLGQLRVSSGLFSSTLKGSLETTSPYRPYRVFITAEDVPDIPYPGSQQIISTSTF